MIHKGAKLFPPAVLRSRDTMCSSAVMVSMSFLEIFSKLLSAEKHKRIPFKFVTVSSVQKARILKKKEVLLPSAPEPPAKVCPSNC